MNEITAPATDRQQFDLSPRNFEQALTFSDYLAESDLVPKDFKGKPGNCLIAMQWGAELGLKPLQAIQNIAVINGRPALWGDAVIALVRSSPVCEYIVEKDDGHTATCTVKRRGEPEQSETFSVDDAKTAGLFGKAGPWQQHPKRMRKLRARAFALRDVFADVLRGMAIAEEVMDSPPRVVHMGVATEVAPAVDATPAPSPAPAAPAALPPYDQAAYEKNLASWNGLIQSGRKTAQQVIDSLRTKATLSEQQERGIRALEAPAPAAEPVREPEPAATAPVETDPPF
jgi:hypothetical protein